MSALKNNAQLVAWLKEQQELTVALNCLTNVDLGSPEGISRALVVQGTIQARVDLLDELTKVIFDEPD